ncbi:MAG: bacillithiol system redox-active protein YtxJ [Crocinitomicaceae bacterium]|nr:bacillithiol system redox-active protein YtxJ [Crocinitomicaceae bacterium]
MGWFSKEKEEKKQNGLPWERLTSVDQLKEVIASSSEKPVLLFKHSTRCSISSMALNSFQHGWEGTPEEIDIYYLDLLNYRDVSNAMALETGVIHQSPQVIVLKNNEVVYTATHSSISARSALNSIKN